MPVTICHHIFGNLDWDDHLSWFEGQVQLEGALVHLLIEPGAGNDALEVINRVAVTRDSFGQRVQLARQHLLAGDTSTSTAAWVPETIYCTAEGTTSVVLEQGRQLMVVQLSAGGGVVDSYPLE